MASKIWHDKVKRLLKSEIVRRGITYEQLVQLLAEMGVQETKAGVESKMSRGTFSAAFLLQCLVAIGCTSFSTEVSVNMVEEAREKYRSKKKATAYYGVQEH